MGRKEIEKSTGNIVFPWHNVLNTLCGLIPQVIASKSEEEKIPNRTLANNLSEWLKNPGKQTLASKKFKKLHSRLASCENARLEYWIFVYLPLSHARKFFSKNAFSVE